MNGKILMAVATAVMAFATACSNGGAASTPSASPSMPAVTTAGAAANPSASPTPATGIITLTKNGTLCQVQALDIDSGALVDIATFETRNANISNNCPRWPGDNPLLFAPDFQRMASTQSGYAGWIGPDGTFTALSGPPERPDFGLPSDSQSVGFDRHGNYYYEVEYGNVVNDSDWHRDYFHVPASRTGGGELIGTQQNAFDTGIARLPGGELGLSPDSGTFGVANCSLDVDIDGDYDPDRTTYFFSQDNVVYRTNEWCVNGQWATPITPRSDNAVFNVLSSPDGTRVVFRMNAGPVGKVYLVDAQGASQPQQVDEAVAEAVYSSTFYAWR
jgi:hypothetical protein